MFDLEKMAVWHQVGAVLAEKYQGRFHNFIRSCPPRLYDNGNGLVERLAKEFPRFNDVSPYDGHTIKFYKLPQLGLWFCYSTLRNTRQFPIDDLTTMTAFADYMVPVALRLLGIMSYSPASKTPSTPTSSSRAIARKKLKSAPTASTRARSCAKK